MRDGVPFRPRHSLPPFCLHASFSHFHSIFRPHHAPFSWKVTHSLPSISLLRVSWRVNARPNRARFVTILTCPASAFPCALKCGFILFPHSMDGEQNVYCIPADFADTTLPPSLPHSPLPATMFVTCVHEFRFLCWRHGADDRPTALEPTSNTVVLKPP